MQRVKKRLAYDAAYQEAQKALAAKLSQAEQLT